MITNTHEILNNYRTWVSHGESVSTTTSTESGSSHVQENLNEYVVFCGMLHNLFPTHDMTPKPMEQGPSMQQPVEGPIENE